MGQPAVAVDIRVVAASNRDLLQHAEEGRFRRDLYYRVAGFAVRVPPLRERRDDIPLLIQHFLRRATGPGGTVGKRVRGLTVRALQALVDYPWPGNVRELENELQRLFTVCRDAQAIESTMLPDRILYPSPERQAATPGDGSLRLEAHVERVERRVILAALERCGGSQRQAAKLLGLSRNGLASKIRRLGISA